MSFLSHGETVACAVERVSSHPRDRYSPPPASDDCPSLARDKAGDHAAPLIYNIYPRPPHILTG